MTITKGKPTPGQEYPDRYLPGGGDELLDEIWECLDMLKPGLLSIEARAFVAGCWRGHLLRVMTRVGLGPKARKSADRPDDYERLTSARQREIDAKLGILDWDGDLRK